MLTFYHAPHSRSWRILALIEEMKLQDWVTTRPVNIVRSDGSGAVDPANPHPEGKVPLLDHDGHLISETPAIMIYLTTLFPGSSMAPAPGTPEWGVFLTWMCWYTAAMEPALLTEVAGLSHPVFHGTWRDAQAVTARLHSALQAGPWIMGDSYSAVDLLLHSPYAWLPHLTPDDPLIRDWVARCQARPANLATYTA